MSVYRAWQFIQCPAKRFVESNVNPYVLTGENNKTYLK